MAKKETAPKAPKRKVATPKRVASEGDSPADPGYPLPKRALSYRDFDEGDRPLIDTAMEEVGTRVYGSPIRMADAVATRVNAVQAAIGRMAPGSHVPEGTLWYGEHQRGYRQVADRTGTRIGSIIDAGAITSARNSPAKERLSAESAGHIAAKPDRMVTITPDMVPHMGNPDITAKDHRIGDLTDTAVAHIGYAETQALKSRGLVDKQGNALASERFTPREVTGVTLDSAGREHAIKAIAVTRGKTFDEVTKGSTPKTRNYARAGHIASDPEDRYNTEVFRRMAQTPTFIESDGRGGHTTFRQGHLWTAADETGFDPSTAVGADESVEDYVMNAMTAHEAASRGTTGKKARAAQEDIKVAKGRGVFDPSVDPEEIRHAFNEEATRRAAAHFGLHGESITPRAAQAIAWTEYRRHTLGEDDEYNRQQKELAKEAKAVKSTTPVAGPASVAQPTPEEKGQLTLF